MIKGIRRFFEDRLSPGNQEAKGGVERRLHLAAAALLVEVACIDNEFSADERARIVAILKEEFTLGVEEAHELIDLAALELDKSVDLWQFASLINERYSPVEKLRLVEMVWQVVYADGRLDHHEDALMKKLSTLLNLRHRELIAAKLKAREAPNMRSD